MQSVRNKMSVLMRLYSAFLFLFLVTNLTGLTGLGTEAKAQEISGFLYEDHDRDGRWDSREPFAENRRVILYETSNGLNGTFTSVAEALTGPLGKFTFDQLEAGSYCIDTSALDEKLSLPIFGPAYSDPEQNELLLLLSGLEQSAKTGLVCGFNLRADEATLTTPKTISSVGLGLRSGSNLEGRLIATGQQGAEAQTSGINIRLYQDTNGDKKLDPLVDREIEVGQTSSQGQYAFNQFWTKAICLELIADSMPFDLQSSQIEGGNPACFELTSETTQKDFTFLGYGAQLGLALAVKQQPLAVEGQPGTFAFSLTLNIVNTGSVDLSNVTVDFPIALQLLQDGELLSVSPDIEEQDSPTRLELHHFYDGLYESRLIRGPNLLAAGQSVKVTINITYAPNSSGDFRLIANGSAQRPDGLSIYDTSTQGQDPDPTGLGPNTSSVPTQINLVIAPEVEVNLEHLNAVTGPELGVFDVTSRFTIENTGLLQISDPQLSFDLRSGLPKEIAALFLSLENTSNQSLSLDLNYDGVKQTQVLLPGQALKPGAKSQINVRFRLDTRDPNLANFGPYGFDYQFSFASGDQRISLSSLIHEIPTLKTQVSPNEPLLISPTRTQSFLASAHSNLGFAGETSLLSAVGISPSAAEQSEGLLTLDFQPKLGLALNLDGRSYLLDPESSLTRQGQVLHLVLQNTGPTYLLAPEIELDLQDFLPQIPPPEALGLGSNPRIETLIARENGDTSVGQLRIEDLGDDLYSLLDGTGILAPGQQVNLKIELQWDSDNFIGPYAFSALAQADAPAALEHPPVADFSQAGLDPDPTTVSTLAIDNQEANKADDPTLLQLDPRPALGLALRLKSIQQASEPGLISATYETLLQNIGNQTISQVQLDAGLDLASLAPARLASFELTNLVLRNTGQADFTAASQDRFLNEGLILSGNRLLPGGEAQATFQVDFQTGGLSSDQFLFGLIAKGIDPLDNLISDLSDNDDLQLSRDSFGQILISDDPRDGFDPDETTASLAPADNFRANQFSQKTPLLLPETPSLGLAMHTDKVRASPDDASVFLVDLTLQIDNLGTVQLDQVQIELDLANQLVGASFLGLEQAPIGHGLLPLNPGYLGQNQGFMGTSLLNQAAAVLPIGGNDQLFMTLRIKPLDGKQGPYSLQALATAHSPDGAILQDFSHNSPELTSDPDNDGQANKDGENDASFFILPVLSALGLAIASHEAQLDVGLRTYSVELDVLLQNVGNTDLENLHIDLDFEQSFDQASDARYLGLSQAEATSAIWQVSGRPLNLNDQFDGRGSGITSLLDQSLSNQLDVGEEALIRMRIRFVLEGQSLGPFLVSGQAWGQDLAGALVEDLSQNGTDPDPSSFDLRPTFNAQAEIFNQETPIRVPGAIGLAQRVSDLGVTEAIASPQGGLPLGQAGEFDLTLIIDVANMGGQTLNRLKVASNLASDFSDAAELVQIFDLKQVSGALLSLNPLFDADLNPDLLDGSDSLAVDASARLSYTARFRPLLNQALNTRAKASALTDDNRDLEDLSQNGATIDPDEDGDPSNNGEPTPINPPFRSSIGLAQQVNLLSAGNENNGPWDVSLDFSLRNLGNTPLSSLELEMDLRALFGASGENWDLLSLTTSDQEFDDSLQPNPNYNGEQITNLLVPSSILSPGQTASIKLDLSLKSLTGSQNSTALDQAGQFSIMSSVYAQGADGLEVFDQSTNGTNVDPNGDGNPNEAEPSLLILSAMAAYLGMSEFQIEEDGCFILHLSASIHNQGATLLSKPQLSLDMGKALGPAFIELTEEPQLTANWSDTGDLPNLVDFEGRGDKTDLFDGAKGSIPSGEILVLDMKIRFDPAQLPADTPASLDMGAIATDSRGLVIKTQSRPRQTADIGTTQLNLAAAGLALEVINIEASPSGNQVAEFHLHVQNLGTSTLSNLQLTSDLVESFGGFASTLSGGSIKVGGGLVGLIEAPQFITPPPRRSLAHPVRDHLGA